MYLKWRSLRTGGRWLRFDCNDRCITSKRQLPQAFFSQGDIQKLPFCFRENLLVFSALVVHFRYRNQKESYLSQRKSFGHKVVRFFSRKRTTPLKKQIDYKVIDFYGTSNSIMTFGGGEQFFLRC